jgi:branched-chain amino acid transport system ATP-binding protein
LACDALSLANVHAFYGDSHILHGVSFSLQPGGVLALLGRNGAGKTTCISAIIGFLKPRDGEIRLFGESIEGLSPERISHLGIGLVPQGRRVFPSLTVRENLAVAQQRESTAGTPWNVDRIYTLFPRLRERHAQYAGTLSGGEQQMLAIGRGLMAEPKLLILDEPSLGLSPLLVEELFALIKAINADGIALLLVEQNVVQSLEVAERAYILDNGMFVLEGKAADLKNDPDLKRTYLGM